MIYNIYLAPFRIKLILKNQYLFKVLYIYIYFLGFYLEQKKKKSCRVITLGHKRDDSVIDWTLQDKRSLVIIISDRARLSQIHCLLDLKRRRLVSYFLKEYDLNLTFFSADDIRCTRRNPQFSAFGCSPRILWFHASFYYYPPLYTNG